MPADVLDLIAEQPHVSADFRRALLTHHMVPDHPGLRLVRALCGAAILSREHSQEPTCPACRARLAEREAAEV